MKTSGILLPVVCLGLLLTAGCNNPKPESKKEFTGPKFVANIRSTEARTPEEERLGFKLPEGFEISLFASEPDIGKPINIAFDAKGRMWVTQSFEYPFPSQPGKGKDKLTILEDTDGDGKADKFTLFSDTLNIPIGVLPVNDGVFAYSIPNIYKYTDANGDGKVDGQKKLFGPFKTKDTHGMINNFVRGYDGWINSCHGFTNRDTIAGTDGDSISMISGNTFRFKLDGSRVEHTTDGRINPFGLVYDERGYIYSTDCHSSPLYQLIPGADYMQWGKEEGMGFAPDMTALTDEATALAGIGYYADVHFPEAYQHNFYVGDVVRCRVYRYSSIFKGSTPIGKREEDFVMSDDPWFRPVDVKLGPDGALYVADFYNSIIGHYEVPLDHPRRDHIRGRIWRITYKGKHNSVTDWTTAGINDLLRALDMDNISVRMTAADQLADRIGTAAAGPVAELLHEKNISTRKYIHSLWVLERLGALKPDMLAAAAVNPDPLIRLHAMHIVAEEKPDEQQLFPLVLKGLQDTDPHVKRAAVQLLIKYPDKRSLELALAARREAPGDDNHLLYAARLSMRNILRNKAIMQQVAAAEWNAKDAGYLADVLMGVPLEEAGTFLYRYISHYKPADGRAAPIFQHIARYVPQRFLDSAILYAMKDKRSDSIDLLVFKGVQTGLDQRGEKENTRLGQWGKSLAENVLHQYPATKGQSMSVVQLQNFAVDMAGKYKLKSAVPALEGFVKNYRDADFVGMSDALTDELLAIKPAAVKALIRIDPKKGSEAALQILNDDSANTNIRNGVGRVLGEFPGNLVNNILRRVGSTPPDLQANIALTLAGSSEGKDILLGQVRKKVMFPRILLQPKVAERMLQNITAAQKKNYDALTSGLSPVDEERQKEIYNRLAEFDKAMQENKPSADSGKLVFVQNCSACHSVGGSGGGIGPNLDGVSNWGARAIAEKLIDPNRNVSENFRTYTIRTKDGKVMTGLYRREEGAVTVFADLTGKEFSVPKKEIAEQTASKLTLMPDNFRERISQRDFNALLVFLLNKKS